MGPVVEKEVEEKVIVKQSDPQKVVRKSQTIVPEHVVGEEPQAAYETKKTIFRSYQVVWYLLGFIEILLFLRVVLLMLGANVGSGFVDLIYGLSYVFAFPFMGMFSSTAIGDTVIEWSAMFGMVIYYLLALGIVKLLQFLNPVEPDRVVKTVDSQA